MYSFVEPMDFEQLSNPDFEIHRLFYHSIKTICLKTLRIFLLLILNFHLISCVILLKEVTTSIKGDAEITLEQTRLMMPS